MPSKNFINASLQYFSLLGNVMRRQNESLLIDFETRSAPGPGIDFRALLPYLNSLED